MSRRGLVSVVMIFRDTERFINEAIDSVFAQTYSDWELLLVDDGSVDASSALACRVAEREPKRVRYLRHAGGVNRGMSASRNLGIRHARGDYLAFLDADDVWSPNTLTDQVGLLTAWPRAAMVYGPLQWWFSWSGKSEDQDRDYVEALGVRPDALVPAPTLVSLFLRNKAAVPSGLLVRREVAEEVGGFEDAFTGEYEDQVFCAKVCLRWPVLASSQCWYRYRQHDQSCVSLSLQSGRARTARLRFLDWLSSYLSQHAIRHSGLWRALRYEQWRWRHTTQYALWQRGKRVRDGLARRAFGRKWSRELLYPYVDWRDARRLPATQYARLPLPPASLRFRVHGDLDLDSFMETGRQCGQDITRALARIGKTPGSFQEILDFGCGCGRVLMWLPVNPGSKLHGTDIDRQAVSWCEHHLGRAEFQVNANLPPLSYADATFDLVYAISIFTHLEEAYQFAWLEEFQRIVQPGGYVLLTIRGDFHRDKMPPLERSQLEQRGFLFARLAKGGRGIFPDFYQIATQSRNYIVEKYSKYFEICDFVSNGLDQCQDIVILRKR